MEYSWLIQSGPLLLLLPTGSPKEPPPLTLETASTTQPTSLLVNFLQYSSIVIQDAKGPALFSASSTAVFRIRIRIFIVTVYFLISLQGNLPFGAQEEAD